MIWRTLTVGVVLLAVVLAYAVHEIHNYWYDPISNSDESVVFDVRKGAGFSEVASGLHRVDVIRKPLYWKVLAHWNQQTQRIKSGEYQIALRSSPAEILRQLVDGDVIRYPLTVVEGTTFADFWQQLRNQPRLDLVLQDKNALQNRLQPVGDHLEGWFMPDTYSYAKGTTDIELLDQSHSLMREFLHAQWERRAKNLPYRNPYEALIMASIIEKETSVEAERSLIAGVFVGRLRKGMKLQTDPAVIYGLGERYDGNIRRQDLREDTPYNTYVHKGLPPTPICLPGRASITAALHPADTQFLYFVAKGDGTHFFSTNYADHAAAVKQYQLKGSQ